MTRWSSPPSPDVEDQAAMADARRVSGSATQAPSGCETPNSAGAATTPPSPDSGNLLARIVAQSIGGRAGSLIVGFGASVALARFLGPAGRGLLGLMSSAVSLGLVVFTLGLPLSAVYHSSRKDTDQGGLLGNSVVQALILTVVLVPAAWLLYPQIASALGRGRGGTTWIVAAALVPVTFLDWTTHAQLQGMLLFGRYGVLQVVSRVAYAAGIVILLGGFGLGVAGGLIALGMSSVVMVLGSLGPILRRARMKLDRPLWRRSLHYGLRVQIGSLFGITNGRLDVIVLQFFRPLSQVGYYVVAQTIAELLLNLAGAFQVSVLPLISHYEGDERAGQTSVDSMRHYGLISAAATLGNAVLGPLVIFFAFGPKFHQAIGPMLVLLPGVWFLGIATVIQGDLSGRGRPGLSSALAGVGAAVTIVLDFALIPPLGVYGGALASVCAYTTYGVGSIVFLSRVSGIPVRTLMVPTRADLALYWRVARVGASALRRRARGPAAEDRG